MMENRPSGGSEGTCIISQEVLVSIAGTAASEIDGVASLANRTDLKRLMDKKQMCIRDRPWPVKWSTGPPPFPKS